MRRLLAALIAIIAIVFIAAIAAPWLIPAGFVKTQLASLAMQKTGRDLRIAGAISFSLLPRVQLTAHDVTLANPPGQFSTDFLTAPAIVISLKPLALLSGALEIDRVQLLQPAISFEIDGEGRRNWIFRRASTTEPGAKETNNTGQSIASGTLTIAGGMASYRDLRKGRKLAASGVDLTATLPSPDGPLNVAGTAVYNGESVTLALYLASPEILRRGGMSGAGLDMISARGSFAFHGEIGGTGSASANGLVELKLPSMRDFSAWARLAPRARLSGPLAITGRIEANRAKVALSDARIGLDTIAAEGALAVERTAGRPLITGQLAVERLDLDPFVKPNHQTATAGPASASPPSAGAPPPPSAEPPPPVAPASPTGWSSAAIDLRPLKLVDADVSLTADAIRVRRIDAGKSQIALHLRDGRLDLDVAAMALYGGKGTGKIVADGSGPVPAFGVRFFLTGIRVSRVPLEIAGLGELSGAGDVSLDVIGHGQNLREIAESLNGIGGVDFADGTIGSAGLGPLMRDALGPAVNDQSIPREIDYSSLSGTAAIARGVLRNGDLKLRSPKLSATASGTLDLAARRIDYLWLPDIPGLGSARIAVTGSWDAPAYKALSVTITKGTKQPERKPR